MINLLLNPLRRLRKFAFEGFNGGSDAGLRALQRDQLLLIRGNGVAQFGNRLLIRRNRVAQRFPQPLERLPAIGGNQQFFAEFVEQVENLVVVAMRCGLRAEVFTQQRADENAQLQQNALIIRQRRRQLFGDDAHFRIAAA